MSACNGKKNSDKKQEEKEEKQNTEVKIEQKADTPVIPASSQPEKKQKMVEIITDFGTMKVRLYDETPLHRDNFLKLANEGFYDGLLFHRVIRNFMIQGGDPNSKNAGPDAQLGGGGPGYTIPAEFNPALYHKKGALAAARMGDQVNPQKASSGSQFYIVQGSVMDEQKLGMMTAQSGVKYSPEQIQAYTTIGGTPFLDGQYTVFGEVVEGLDVIDKIAAVQTRPGDRPVQDVKMTIRVVKK
ncbi:MAG: peptidylprolyl isomerase [Bacteroidetes bacterium]|nr:peptidylprolyl isomerase [Bacteroidota bacterium]